MRARSISAFGVALDRFNTVRFDAILAQRLRFDIDLQAGCQVEF